MSGSDSDNDRKSEGRRRGENEDQNELASKTFSVGSKTYFVDVKENDKGRFVKLVERGRATSGKKNKISLSMNMVEEFKTRLEECQKKYEQVEKDGVPEFDEESDDRDGGLIHSIYFRSLGKRVYLDLKNNQRGVFLRISLCTAMKDSRRMVALPADRIQQLIDILTEFYKDYGQDEKPDLPNSKNVRAERKQFFFDCGRNDRGVFLRVSEVTPHYRSSVTIPKTGMKDFRDAIDELYEKMHELES